MNPLDIYKRLPRNNCGECPAKTCMAFAVNLSRGECSVSECPEINEQSKKEIPEMLSDTGDWKEKRLAELFDEISHIDLSAIAKDIGAGITGDSLKLKYMGREITIKHSRFMEDLDISDKLLILIYIKHSGSSPLSDTWKAFRELKDGLIRAKAFTEMCELPLAKLFDKNRQELLDILIEMGARKVTGFSSECSLVIHPLPKVPFLILLRPGEEGFDPDCKVLLDSTVTEFIDVEVLLYLGLAFVKAIKTWPHTSK